MTGIDAQVALGRPLLIKTTLNRGPDRRPRQQHRHRRRIVLLRRYTRRVIRQNHQTPTTRISVGPRIAERPQLLDHRTHNMLVDRLDRLNLRLPITLVRRLVRRFNMAAHNVIRIQRIARRAALLRIIRRRMITRRTAVRNTIPTDQRRDPRQQVHRGQHHTTQPIPLGKRRHRRTNTLPPNPCQIRRPQSALNTRHIHRMIHQHRRARLDKPAQRRGRRLTTPPSILRRRRQIPTPRLARYLVRRRCQHFRVRTLTRTVLQNVPILHTRRQRQRRTKRTTIKRQPVRSKISNQNLRLGLRDSATRMVQHRTTPPTRRPVHPITLSNRHEVHTEHPVRLAHRNAERRRLKRCPARVIHRRVVSQQTHAANIRTRPETRWCRHASRDTTLTSQTIKIRRTRRFHRRPPAQFSQRPISRTVRNDDPVFHLAQHTHQQQTQPETTP